MTVEISLLIAVIGCFMGLAGYLSNRDTKLNDSAEWRGRVDTKLDIACAIRKDVEAHGKDIEDMKERLVAVEQSCKSAHHRLDRLEGYHDEH